MSLQPYNTPGSIFRPGGTRHLRNIVRQEDVALATVDAAYNVAAAGSARVATLTLAAANLAQVVPEAAPRLNAINDAYAICVVSQVMKFNR